MNLSHTQRRLLSFTILLCLCINLSSHLFAVKANAAEVNGFDEQLLEEEAEMTRLDSSTLDETYGFSDEAIHTIDSLVSMDDSNLYHIENEEELKKNLTDEEYSAVLEQIKKSNDSVMASAAGSEGNPYILKPDTTLHTGSGSASNTWYKISDIRGVTDFIISSTRALSVTIYKKTLFSKTKIGTAYGAYVNKVISASATNNNANTYIINIDTNSGGDTYTRVRQHRDSTITYHPKGGTVWKSDSLSAIPNTNLLTMRLWYLKVEDVDKLSTFVNNDKYLQYVDGFMNKTMTAASIATAIWGVAGGGNAATVIGIALTLISESSPLNFRQVLLDKLNTAGGWNGTKYTKSVVLKEVFVPSSALTFYYVSTWTGSILYGEPGYTGTFSQSGR